METGEGREAHLSQKGRGAFSEQESLRESVLLDELQQVSVWREQGRSRSPELAPFIRIALLVYPNMERTNARGVAHH